MTPVNNNASVGASWPRNWDAGPGKLLVPATKNSPLDSLELNTLTVAFVEAANFAQDVFLEKTVLN